MPLQHGVDGARDGQHVHERQAHDGRDERLLSLGVKCVQTGCLVVVCVARSVLRQRKQARGSVLRVTSWASGI